MTPLARSHLSVDELDLLHAGNPTPRATSHIETCHECRTLLASDTRLIAALEQLPTWEPESHFAERVMQRLSPVPATTSVAATSHLPTDRERSARRRVFVGGSLAAGLLTGAFAWAMINPELALNLAEPAWHDLTGSFWTAVQAVSANAAEQPWMGPLRDAVATPARALPMLAAASALYTVALIGLRRLLTRPAIDARW